MQDFKERMLVILLQQAELLAEMNQSKKLSPEQIRTNVGIILSILTEAEEYYAPLFSQMEVTN